MVKFCPQYGACSSMAERFPVEEDVVGSKPIRHPEYRNTFTLSKDPESFILGLSILESYLNIQ
jgi:hypothetical protein